MIQTFCIICKLINFLFWTGYAKIFYTKTDFFRDLFLRLHHFNLIIVKILQCSANNNDLWSNENKELLKMYTDNVPYNHDDIDYHAINELMMDKQIIFNNFEKPLHSGTISIVYDGIYLDKKVIIKIKRKNIEDRLSKDNEELQNMMFLLKWIPYINKLQIEDNYNIYKPLLETQCNFKNEIKNQELYKKNFKNYNLVKIPTIYNDRCTTNSIVMEYIDGFNISDIENTDKNKFMDIMGHVMIHSLVVHGFFHCDAHAGNILFIKDEDVCQICLIDFGICGMYNIKELNNYYDIFTVIGTSDYNEVAKLFLTNFTNCPSNHRDYDLIFTEAKNLLHNSFELKKEFSFSEIYTLYSILKKYDIYTNESWMKTELAIASIDGCMKELKYNDIGLTDILKQKINELNELENSELLN